jgi:hypothetical protein
MMVVILRFDQQRKGSAVVRLASEKDRTNAAPFGEDLLVWRVVRQAQ